METLMNMPVHYAIGEYYYRGRPALGAAAVPIGDTVNKALDAMEGPWPRVVASGALAVGGILMAASEVSRGAKGHHGGAGRVGRIAVGGAAAYYGLLWAFRAWQQTLMG